MPVVVVLGAPALGGWTASLVDGASVGTGVAVGALVGVLAVAGRWQVRRYARTRGAAAWDWTTGRHVAHGDPSRRVQHTEAGADRRPGAPSGR